MEPEQVANDRGLSWGYQEGRAWKGSWGRGGTAWPRGRRAELGPARGTTGIGVTGQIQLSDTGGSACLMLRFVCSASLSWNLDFAFKYNNGINLWFLSNVIYLFNYVYLFWCLCLNTLCSNPGKDTVRVRAEESWVNLCLRFCALYFHRKYGESSGIFKCFGKCSILQLCDIKCKVIRPSITWNALFGVYFKVFQQWLPRHWEGPLKSASPSYGFSFSPSQTIPLVHLVIHGMLSPLF